MTDKTKIEKPEVVKVVTPTPSPLTLSQKLQVQAMTTDTEIFNPVMYQQLKTMANDLSAAGALPSGMNAQQALVIMQFGSELGIKPFTALQNIYIVKGKMVLYGSMVISRLTQAGYKVEYKDTVSDKDEDSCEVTVTGHGEEYKENYTFKMAEQSGFTKGATGLKPGWIKGTNRILKLRYGGVSMLLKSHLPHLLNGAEIKEVWEDVTLGSPTETLDDGTPVTPEQVETIKSMGGEIVEGLTKKQAAETIKNLAKGGK